MMECGLGRRTFTNTTVGTTAGTGTASCTGMNPGTFMDMSACTSTGTNVVSSTSTDEGTGSGGSESTSTAGSWGMPRATSKTGWKKMGREVAVVVLLFVQVLVQVFIRALQPSS